MDESLDYKAESLCFELQGILGTLTSIQPSKNFMVGLLGLARSAAVFASKLSLHPAEYKYTYQSLNESDVFDPELHESINHPNLAVAGDAILGCVFPALVKIRDESGDPVGLHLWRCSAMLTISDRICHRFKSHHDHKA